MFSRCLNRQGLRICRMPENAQKSVLHLASTFPCAVMYSFYPHSVAVRIRDIKNVFVGVRLNTVHPSVSVTVAVSISSSDSLYSLLNRLQNIAASNISAPSTHRAVERERRAELLRSFSFSFLRCRCDFHQETVYAFRALYIYM